LKLTHYWPSFFDALQPVGRIKWMAMRDCCNDLCEVEALGQLRLLFSGAKEGGQARLEAKRAGPLDWLPLREGREIIRN